MASAMALRIFHLAATFGLFATSTAYLVRENRQSSFKADSQHLSNQNKQAQEHTGADSSQYNDFAHQYLFALQQYQHALATQNERQNRYPQAQKLVASQPQKIQQFSQQQNQQEVKDTQQQSVQQPVYYNRQQQKGSLLGVAYSAATDVSKIQFSGNGVSYSF